MVSECGKCERAATHEYGHPAICPGCGAEHMPDEYLSAVSVWEPSTISCVELPYSLTNWGRRRFMADASAIGYQGFLLHLLGDGVVTVPWLVEETRSEWLGAPSEMATSKAVFYLPSGHVAMMIDECAKPSPIGPGIPFPITMRARRNGIDIAVYTNMQMVWKEGKDAGG